MATSSRLQREADGFAPLPRITFPRDVARQTESLHELMARLQPDTDDRPDLIVVLLRSAPVPFAAVRACAAANEISLPPVVEAHIGSELYGGYLDQCEPQVDIPFGAFGPAENRFFERWLDGFHYAGQIVTALKRDARTAGVTVPRKVLLYDDFKSSGGTLHAARYLVQKAFPHAETESSIAGFRLEQFTSAMRLRLKLNHKPLKSVERFLWTLLTGYGESEEGVFALDSREQLQRLGQQLLTPDTPNPYLLFAEIYGDTQLMGFSQHIRKAFSDWGCTVALSPLEEKDPPREK